MVEVENADIRAEVEHRLLQLSQDLFEMEVCAGDVGKDREGAVPEYLAKINEHFVRLSELARSMPDSVPLSILESIDAFRNPHIQTKNMLVSAVAENQHALGRISGLETFRQELSEAVAKDFPDATTQ